MAPSKIKIVIGFKVDFLDLRLSDLMKLEDGPNQVTIPCSLKYAAFKRYCSVNLTHLKMNEVDN